MIWLQPLLPAITSLHTHLLKAPGARWLIGGSCGLLMHHVEIGRSPRDLDIYVDNNDVAPVHTALQEYAVDSPVFSQTPIYSSILSHYLLNGIPIELVGDFHIEAISSNYQVEIAYLWESHCHTYKIGKHEVKVMPLAHELIFNLLRGRSDRYEAIAFTMLS
ncbi:nucleotidyltransferase family protein, partial [Paenibacillus sp. N3.4]|uniref:nucleotidyltransferase family protein n=1 Tax=Paenibacillus sp. N3.4 TaxID=2603222 RepID=UPI0011CA9024